MFSKFFRSSTAFLFPHSALSDSVTNLQANQQIQSELEQAADQDMVSTRSQEDTPASGASQSSRLLYPQVVVHEKKRRIGNEAEESPAQNMTKRRRRSAEPKGDATPSSNVNKPGRPRKSTSAKSANGDTTQTSNHNESDREYSTQGRRPTSPQTHGIDTDRTLNVGEEDKAVAVAINDHTQGSRNEARDVNDPVEQDAEDVTKSRRERIPKKKAKGAEKAAHVDENAVGGSSIGNRPEMPLATANKATHKRFGSEDIEVLGTLRSIGIEERKGSQKDQSEDEGESGDEAPEIVTASAGFDKARTLTLEAAKVASRQKAEKRLKRREHDERLRLQAKSAKDSRSKDKPSAKSQRTKGSLAAVSEADNKMPIDELRSLHGSPKVIRDEDRKSPAKSKVSGKAPLPLLLPEEILAAQPVNQSPKPPFSNSKVATNQKRKLVNFDSKPPKDIKRGNVKICVLQNKRSILPPESSQASKALRESWLSGRRGLKGAIVVPRQKPSNSFVRKR